MKPFTPRFEEEDLHSITPVFPPNIENSAIYAAVGTIINTAVPEVNGFKDEIWSDFYLPLRRGKKVVAVPVKITKVPQCRDKYVVSIGVREPLHISPGQESGSQDYLHLFQEIGKLTPFIQQDASLVERIVPYDIRIGKIQGKYILEELMSSQEKERILQKYQEHQKRKLNIENVSLDDYLKTAAICYRAAFGDEVKGLSPAEMYRQRSYQHNVDAFSISDPKSKKEFSQKQQSNEWQGCHLFWLTPSRIHLNPPEKGKPYFSLSSGLHSGSHAYLKIVDSLIEEAVPFQTTGLEGTLRYLIGEEEFSVNLHSKYFPSIEYYHSPEQQQKYFPHITWDPLNVPKWKAG